jgi:hypothetical protein
MAEYSEKFDEISHLREKQNFPKSSNVYSASWSLVITSIDLTATCESDFAEASDITVWVLNVLQPNCTPESTGEKWPIDKTQATEQTGHRFDKNKKTTELVYCLDDRLLTNTYGHKRWKDIN